MPSTYIPISQCPSWNVTYGNASIIPQKIILIQTMTTKITPHRATRISSGGNANRNPTVRHTIPPDSKRCSFENTFFIVQLV